MQYPFLTLLEIISVLAILFFGIVLFYFLIKKWQGKSFKQCLMAILLYELASFLLYLIYSFSPLYRILILNNGAIFLKVLNVLIFTVVLFLVFYFIMKKFLSLSWKKSLVSFILVILILFPLLDFFLLRLKVIIVNLPIFTKENLEIEKQTEACMQNLSSCLSAGFPEPLSWRIIEKIEAGTISWPGNYLGQIIRQI